MRWDVTPWRADLLATARWLLLLRREHPALRSERFYSGRPYVPGRRPDLAWFDALGVAFDHDRWHDPSIRTLQMVRHCPAARGGHGAAGHQRLARRRCT